MSIRAWSIIMFVLFLGIMAWMSILAARENVSGDNLDEEYYLGGRNTGPIILAFSYVTGSVSASAFMGEPGVMSVVGWPYYWLVIAIIPGMVLPALLLLKRLRSKSETLGSLTIPQFLGQHYNSDAIRLITAISICVFYVFPLVAQFKGAAVLLEAFTNIPFKIGVLIFTLFIAIFCATGGLRSVMWASIVQGIPMFFIAIVLVVVSLKAVGGFTGIENTLSVIDPDMLKIVQPRSPDVIMPIEGVIGVFAYWAISFVSQPYLASRFMVIRDTKPKTIATFLIWSLVLTIIFNTLYLTGLPGRILYPDIAGDYITSQLAIDFLPPIFAAVMMIGIFGAMMSTSQSMILTIAQAVANDIYVESINPGASEKKVVSITRISIFAVSAVCLIFTWLNPPEFLSSFLYLGLSGVGACIAVPLFAALMWPKASKRGAVGSALIGPIAYIIFQAVLNINVWFSSLLAVIVSAIILVIFSYIDKNEDEIVEV